MPRVLRRAGGQDDERAVVERIFLFALVAPRLLVRVGRVQDAVPDLALAGRRQGERDRLPVAVEEDQQGLAGDRLAALFSSLIRKVLASLFVFFTVCFLIRFGPPWGDRGSLAFRQNFCWAYRIREFNQPYSSLPDHELFERIFGKNTGPLSSCSQSQRMVSPH